MAAAGAWAGLLGGMGKGEGEGQKNSAMSDEMLAATIRAVVQEETRVLMYLLLALAGMVAAMAVFLVSFAARQMRAPGVPVHGAPESLPSGDRPGRTSSRASTRDASPVPSCLFPRHRGVGFYRVRWCCCKVLTWGAIV